jgi:hypothetical protein
MDTMTACTTQGWTKHQQEHQPIRATATAEKQDWTQLQLEQQQRQQETFTAAGVTNFSSTLMDSTAAVAW